MPGATFSPRCALSLRNERTITAQIRGKLGVGCQVVHVRNQCKKAQAQYNVYQECVFLFDFGVGGHDLAREAVGEVEHDGEDRGGPASEGHVAEACRQHKPHAHTTTTTTTMNNNNNTENDDDDDENNNKKGKKKNRVRTRQPNQKRRHTKESETKTRRVLVRNPNGPR
eukprot:1542887-Rhodomonas_salina.1